MLTICVQAGGESRRMGQDKALMPFLGRPLIKRVIDRLSPIADEVIVTTNIPDDYRFLNLPLFPDLKPGRGSLGLVAAPWADSIPRFHLPPVKPWGWWLATCPSPVQS